MWNGIAKNDISDERMHSSAYTSVLVRSPACAQASILE